MKTFKNSKKDDFFNKLIKSSLESENDNLIIRCKFNFSYMDFNQSAGQTFKDWGEDKIIKLLKKLIEYSKNSLTYWNNQRVGGASQNVLEVYHTFPRNSDFIHPSYIPHEVSWARFRLESAVRLIGFVLPKEYYNKKHLAKDIYFDCNTFYIVFLDENHKFYKTEK